MKKMMIRVATLALAVPGTLGVTDALAFRLIQNTGSGRMTSGARVTCDDPAGYVHWNTSSLSWRLNPAGQGGKAGVAAAVQSAMTSWNNVSPAPYTLNYAGTTNAGFVTNFAATLALNQARHRPIQPGTVPADIMGTRHAGNRRTRSSARNEIAIKMPINGK